MNREIRYVVYCSDFYVAARYAADRDWHLSWWEHLDGDFAPAEPIVFVRDFSREWLPEA